jgi:hypothetical protein
MMGFTHPLANQLDIDRVERLLSGIFLGIPGRTAERNSPMGVFGFPQPVLDKSVYPLIRR